MSAVLINSDSIISDIDSHFKVSAGPGAGKTHWLINHIKHVLYNSKHLFRSKKIGCITYTNNAVENILNRLGTSVTQVEVSTVHSFLYKHIVKPYVSFIANEYGLRVELMDGHSENIPSNYGFLKDWKDKAKEQRITDNKELIRILKILRWKLDNKDLIVEPNYPRQVGGYSIKKKSYLIYKEMAWGKGILHHDDVLFFSYKILIKYPYVAKILATKFPYLFIDEFQDSNPIQVEIFKFLGNENISTGIIGDMMQSIYKFQGADFQQFNLFSLPKIKEYQMQENRRSSNEILECLNSIRTDIHQEKVRNVSMHKPIIFIGNVKLILAEAKKRCNTEEVYCLSWRNITLNAIKLELNETNINDELLDNLKIIDSSERGKIVYSYIKAIAYGIENKFKEAIKEIDNLLYKEVEKTSRKKEALRILSILLKIPQLDISLLEFTNFLRINLNPKLSNFKDSALKDFYINHTLNELLLCVSIPDDKKPNKTIHKAKGEEFDNVLLVLTKEKEIEFLTKPDLMNKEEHRINYVAVSRARNRLFLAIPTLAKDLQDKLKPIFGIENI